MKEEINRRLDILSEKKVPTITAMMLRGGMQERLHRQELLRYGEDIKEEKFKLKKRLHSMVEQERRSEKEKGKKDVGFMFASSSEETLDDFREPVMRRTRSKRGFF